MAERIEIGYLCDRGPHYCFYADPEENGACGSKAIGRVYVELDVDPADLDDGEAEAWVTAANDGLAQVYRAWREG